MLKLTPISVAALVVLIASVSPVGADQSEEARPNIVVFLVDDMGLMDTSVPFLTDTAKKPQRHALNDFYRTPSMQRLAAQGIRFSQFYAMSVCSPTRISIMTGQTSARHHSTNWIKPESNNRGNFGPQWQWKGISRKHVTLPALLKPAGYRTIHCGKANFGPNKSFGEKPENFGFDVNIAGCAYGAPGSYYGTDNFGHGRKGRQGRAVPGLEKYHGKDIHLTEALMREINDAISSSVKANKPFFAYMSHYAVHAPFQPDSRFIGNDKQASAGAKNKGRGNVFASMIEGMDKSLGDILDHLEQLGVAENTLVFFLGDNGTDAPLGPTHDIACAAPLRGKKGTHYEGGMRVPFIAAWAKPDPSNAFQKQLPIPEGTIVDDIGVVYDLFPTVLAVAGVNREKETGADYVIDGIDLRPLLSGKHTGASHSEREFLMHFPHQHRSSYFTSYRRGDWKVIYHYREPEDQRYELFHLSQDFDESRNLAKRQPEKLREMVAAMTKALEAADAQYPLGDDKQPQKPIAP